MVKRDFSRSRDRDTIDQRRSLVCPPPLFPQDDLFSFFDFPYLHCRMQGLSIATQYRWKTLTVR